MYNTTGPILATILRDFFRARTGYNSRGACGGIVVNPDRELSGSIVILGAGYTGRHLYALATAQGFPILASSRTPERRLGYVPPSQRLEFDLERPDTWQNVPSDAHLIWCFPAAPIDSVAACAETLVPRARRLIVLGSTAAYRPATAGGNGLIDETSAINVNMPRVAGEELLRCRHHAVVLRVAGIYGPGRNVLDWIRRGRITDVNRFVNLVHVEDLAGVCLRALERARPGETYNVSDGYPRRWAEIYEVAAQRWGVHPPTPTVRGEERGKRLSIAKLRAELDYTFKHPDLYAVLDAIDSCEQ